jgi:hypothetical protein
MTHSVVRQRLARLGSRTVETASAFPGALFTIALLGVSGLIFHFSDLWQRVTMIGMAVAAFLMVVETRRTLSREIDAVDLRLYEIGRSAANATSQSRKGPPPLPKIPSEAPAGYGQPAGRSPPPPPPIRRRPTSSSVTPDRRRTA